MIFSLGQNYLRPQDIEKIVSTFDRFADVERYARVVPLEEISGEANDCNLNIRRYVDNSPPPEPHDVRAHLLGGVPVVSNYDNVLERRTHELSPRLNCIPDACENNFSDHALLESVEQKTIIYSGTKNLSLTPYLDSFSAWLC